MRWELERQRQALAALLLGTAEASDPERRGLETELEAPDTAETVFAGIMGGALGERLALEGPERRTPYRGEGHLRRMLPEIPLSAWERVLGAERAFSQSGEEAETEAGPLLWKRNRTGSGDGEAPRAEDWTVPARRDGESTVRETVSGRSGRALAGEMGGPGEENFSSGRSGGRPPFEETAAGRKEGRLERSGTARRGGGFSTPPGIRGTSVSPAAEEPAGARPWGEGAGDARLRAEDGAKALSRAVQQDARRYDGGFTIY